MDLFIDTANIEEIREIAAWGVLSGVTTNPSLMAKESGADFKTTIQMIADLVDGPISAEVVSLDAKGMLREAEDIVKWHPNVVIKIPTTPDGLQAIAALSAQGIPTNATLVFSPTQALLVAKAGATYCSPFVGRIDDMGQDGMAVLAEIVEVYEAGGLDTLVLAASIRHLRHVVDSARIGADVATVPYKVLKQMIKHPLTDTGLAQFVKDWEGRK